ncbi:iron donor protein CyaY [Ideonella sp. DXS29W]|uniref:Iron-sulfur cluster assembly protein CyaY n=1 Tax=Ideonella lacteola TaxID=2984193 RepID=A0ABU9BTU9_9BURK
MPAPLHPPDPLSDADYRRLCDAVLAQIETTLDRWLEEDVIDIDAHRSGGLLELAFPAGTKIVVNAQPPLQELWLAARAGGYHFRYDGLAWHEREGREFFELLSRLASEQAGRPLRFSPPGEVGASTATLTP